jgi:hypothetical protein
LNAVTKASAVFGTAALIAVVGLFGPLMPGTAQTILILVLFLVLLVEFVTIVVVFMNSLSEGLAMGRNSISAEEAMPLRVAAVALFVLVGAENIVHASWLGDEVQPFMALWLAWIGGWAVRRLSNHQRAIEALGAKAAADRGPSAAIDRD